MSEFFYQEPYPIKQDKTEYRKISSDYVKMEKCGDREILRIDPKGLEVLSQEYLKFFSLYVLNIPLERCSASVTPVYTSSPFLATTIAVPVS